MNSRPHILFHRPTPWESPIQCSTKTYAGLFSASGYRTTYLQSLINPGHLITRRGYYSTWRRGSRFEGGIWVTGGFSLIPYLDSSVPFAKATGRLRYRTCIPSLRKLVLRSGFGNPQLIWTTIPGSTVLKKIFPEAKLVFHVVDHYSGYRGDAVAVLEAEDYSNADHIFVVGDVLRDLLERKFRAPREKITNLGQGVSLAKYGGDFSIPAELAKLPRPLAIWVGQIKKLDPVLLQAAVAGIGQRGGCVALIGPGDEQLRQTFKDDDRLVFLGPKPPDQIPAYLRSSDIGLMLYDRSRPEIHEYQHPLKLYEYAAAGLPVISTDHREYDQLAPPVILVRDEKEIAHALNRCEEEQTTLREQMKAFAARHSWDRCVEKAGRVIERLLADEGRSTAGASQLRSGGEE